MPTVLSPEELTGKVMQMTAAISVLQDQNDSQSARIRTLERKSASQKVIAENLIEELDLVKKRLRICEGAIDGR